MILLDRFFGKKRVIAVAPNALVQEINIHNLEEQDVKEQVKKEITTLDARVRMLEEEVNLLRRSI
jgi:cell division protein FtsB